MRVLVLPEETKAITTTLFELISAMQQHATTPLEEALIVPTVVNLLQSGRIRFERECHELSGQT
jgi:hypothetical protein